MKAKSILSIAAFFTAFAVSAALVMLFFPVNTTNYRATSCFTNHSNSATATAITALVRQDVSNGNERDRKIYRLGIDVNASFDDPAFADYAGIIENYADASNSLDAGELPRDFRYAWHKHMKAWSEYSAFLNNVKDYRNWNVDSDKFQQKEALHIREIEVTWYRVLRVARNHGSDVRGY